MIKIAIIGAGMTGISLSNFIKNRTDITIFEKSRGVGGRMASRRAEPYIFNRFLKQMGHYKVRRNMLLIRVIRGLWKQHRRKNHPLGFFTLKTAVRRSLGAVHSQQQEACASFV